MLENKFAFSAANTFPLKVLLHQPLASVMRLEHKIIPVHVQLNPTNRCNFSCGFCSCSGRDKNLELPLESVVELMTEARSLGCQSATITGGGEPTLHHDFREMVEKLRGLQIQLGLVTNGSLLNYYLSRFFDNFVWVRVSAGDKLPKQLRRIGLSLDSWLDHIDLACKGSTADWAFSYVVGSRTNYGLIAKIVEFANSHSFSHVRIVNDILEADSLQHETSLIRQYLHDEGIVDSLVNYQSRSSYTRGINPCYISLLKPVISAEGKIFPCCGTQYALVNPSRDYEVSMCMGSNLSELIKNQRFFDGSVCQKCYYSQYNLVLGYMLHGIKHSAFL